MILQLGALFSGLATGLGTVLRQALPVGLQIGQQFLQRELGRRDRRQQLKLLQAQATAALNTPGISVATLGGTIQPVGGRVQRSTFTAAALTPAQSPFGNIPLLPVGNGFGSIRRILTGPGKAGVPFGPPVPGIDFPFGKFAQGSLVHPTTNGGNMANGRPRMADVVRGPQGIRLGSFPGEPRFAQDEMGRTIMFVPDPRGQGFLSVQQARSLNLSAMKPWWRWNRAESQFEKMKPRRLNPFNFKAASRAGRRIERTLDAVKELVRIEKKMTSGKVSLKKRKRKKR